jgi:Phage tail protein
VSTPLPPLTPPAPAQPGQDYLLNFSFSDYEGGSAVDPTLLQLEITYGEEAGLAPDYAGPFTWTGATAGAAAPGVLWRNSVGSYSFWWSAPGDALPGVYVANWTAVYGPGGDQFLAFENFPLLGGPPFTPMPSGDTGFWTGSLTYQPSWTSSPLVIDIGATDSNGVAWAWLSLDGWDSPPTAGQGVIQRSADHGGWPAPQFLGPRILSLKVIASAPTQALRDQARAQLQQCVPVNDLATLQYNEPVPKIAYVRRNATATVAEQLPTQVDAIFTIPLVCPDPRKYAIPSQTATLTVAPPSQSSLSLPFSLPVSFPGNVPPGATTITATNSGTFETRPTISVSGPISSPAVVNASLSQQVSFTGLSLGPTDVLVLDMDSRQALLNGNFTPADVSSAWWVMQPGSTQIYLGGVTSGGASLSVTWASSFI